MSAHLWLGVLLHLVSSRWRKSQLKRLATALLVTAICLVTHASVMLLLLPLFHMQHQMLTITAACVCRCIFVSHKFQVNQFNWLNCLYLFAPRFCLVLYAYFNDFLYARWLREFFSFFFGELLCILNSDCLQTKAIKVLISFIGSLFIILP